MTLSDLTLAAQQRADMVNSNFVSSSEWTSYINQSYFELYDILIQKFGNEYYLANPYSITTDGTNYLYALPSDFYKLLGVDLNTGVQNMPWLSLVEFPFAERNNYVTPQAGRNLQLWYVPRLTPLVNQTDTCDGVSGWTEYIIVDAAIKARIKEESNVEELYRMKKDLLSRIESAAENRDAGEPQTVSDIYARGPYSYFGPLMKYRLAGNNLWLGQYQTIYPYGAGYPSVY